MAKIAVLYCKKVKDVSCIACIKCYKGMKEGNGEYGQHDEIELVAMTDCGDCPGVLVPKVKVIKEMTTAMGQELDVIHLGTCMKLAMETAECPIDLDHIQPILEAKFGIKVVLGTHSY